MLFAQQHLHQMLCSALEGNPANTLTAVKYRASKSVLTDGNIMVKQIF